MRRAKLGAAVLTLASLLAACSDPAPPASIVRHEGQVEDVPESPTTTESPSTVPPPAVPSAGESPDLDVPEAPTSTVRATTTVPAAPRVAVAPARAGAGACGGNLPPCSVMNRESGGNPAAIGYGQCGEDDCYGKWQADPDTAESLGYPRRLDLEPEEVQDQFARDLMARDGCGSWSTC